jgi:ABC-type multidrug transport system fused ATPase/permease subunit
MRGKIKGNLDGHRGRYHQTMENAKLINDLLVAMLLTAVAIILGGKAIYHWGSLVVYIVALRYCLNHLNKIVVTFTSINRFYPIFSRHFYFLDSFEFPKPLS